MYVCPPTLSLGKSHCWDRKDFSALSLQSPPIFPHHQTIYPSTHFSALNFTFSACFPPLCSSNPFRFYFFLTQQYVKSEDDNQYPLHFDITNWILKYFWDWMELYWANREYCRNAHYDKNHVRRFGFLSLKCPHMLRSDHRELRSSEVKWMDGGMQHS